MDVCSNEFLEVLESLHDQDKAFEIRAVFQKLTMDVIVRSAFGVQSNVQKNTEMTGMNAMIKEILEGLQQFRTGWLSFLVGKHFIQNMRQFILWMLEYVFFLIFS